MRVTGPPGRWSRPPAARQRNATASSDLRLGRLIGGIERSGDRRDAVGCGIRLLASLRPRLSLVGTRGARSRRRSQPGAAGRSSARIRPARPRGLGGARGRGWTRRPRGREIDHRVREGVVVVVREARDDRCQAGCGDGQREDRPDQPAGQPADRGAPGPDQQQADDRRDAPRERRDSRGKRPVADAGRPAATQGPATTTTAAVHQRWPGSTAGPDRQHAARLGEVVGELVDEQRDDISAMTSAPTTPARTIASALGDRRRASATSSAPTDGSRITPSTWHCITTPVPTAAADPPARRPDDHARHAPASAIALDSAMRFGFQMNVDSDGRRRDRHQQPGDERRPPVHRSPAPATTSPPPRSRPGRSAAVTPVGIAAGQRTRPGRAGSSRARRGGRPDRRRRAEQRHHPDLDERPQDQHVVALVGVPGPARGHEPSKAAERRGRSSSTIGTRSADWRDPRRGRARSVTRRVHAARQAPARPAAPSAAHGPRSPRRQPRRQRRQVAPRRDVEAARVQVDRVVALVHAGRLEDVRDVRPAPGA